MFKLFQPLFGPKRRAGDRYDPALLQAAVDRAIAATDPRVRSLSGHRRRLEAATVRAIDHVVALVDALPPPVEASAKTYGEDGRLSAFFASGERMAQVFGSDRALLDFLASPAGAGAEPVHALLAVERTEKKVLGMALQGEQVQYEVSQVQVSFDRHRLLDPAPAPDDHRRQLLRRAFDQLLTIALARITQATADRESLAAERSVLRAKLRALESSNWGMTGQEGGEETPAAIEARLAGIDARLRDAGAGAGTLPRHLDLLVETLECAPEQLGIEPLAIVMDRMGIRQDAPGGTAVELALQEVRNRAGQALVVLPVLVPRGAIRARDVMAEIRRELGSPRDP